MKVLVAYATRHGATRGIAERIAQTLERNGLEVTLEPVAKVRSVDGYDAFVVGSAAYMGGWLNDATAFVRRNRSVLAARPVWLFSSGPIGTDLVDSKGRDVVAASVPKEFGEFSSSLAPRDEKIFFGAFNPDQPAIGLMEKLGAPFMRMSSVRASMPTGDFRDWPAIEAWADGIAGELAGRPAPSEMATSA